MPISSRLLYTLVEIWARRGEPETADLRRAVHAADVLGNDPSSPTHLRAFAWRLVDESHRAAGWNLPPDVGLANCRAAADSLAHATSLLINDVAPQVRGVGEPVLLLGGLADSQAVFGRWDLLPSNGVTLVSLEASGRTNSSVIDLPVAGGIRWASAGGQHRIYEELSIPVSLNGDQVLVPRAELIAARSADRGVTTDDPAALVFCGAAYEAIGAGKWAEVMRIAKRLGRTAAPTEAAAALDLDTSLGLQISGVRRWSKALRQFLRR